MQFIGFYFYISLGAYSPKAGMPDARQGCVLVGRRSVEQKSPHN